MSTWALHVLFMLSATIAAQTTSPSAPSSAPPVGLDWVRIPAGTFEMGCVPSDTRCAADERPRHTVTISKPFELLRTEVTLGQFKAAIPEIDPQPPWSTSPEHPVVSVDWDESVAFCRVIGGRLPTEAEWEYAARGGRTDAIYPWGNEEPVDRATAAGGAAFEGDSARPVRSFAANGFGLFDMAGNVWEWVNDFGGFYPADPAADPIGPDTGRVRVVRGGAYGDDAANLRVSNRTPNAPDRINVNVGFRCARDLDSQR